MKKNDNDYIEIDVSKLRERTRILLTKTLPLWMVIVLIINSSLATGIIEYYILERKVNILFEELEKTTKDPKELVQILKQQVIPQKGFVLSARWTYIGKKLLSSGVIDKTKYDELFGNDPQYVSHMKMLEENSNENMRIDERNARFMVNTLWALGLVNKSRILDEGSMKTIGDGNYMGYASTGGWNLGSRPTSELYSAESIIPLTPEQEDIVKKIAQSVYRPCCGNHTEFPDCNHGMAVLGYIQLAVSQGITEKQIYKDILALNSFWFPQNYVEIASYFEKEGVAWKNVDAKRVLSAEFSSSTGAAKVREAIQTIPDATAEGGGCSA